MMRTLTVFDRLGIHHRMYISSGVFLVLIAGWAAMFVSGKALGLIALISLGFAGIIFLLGNHYHRVLSDIGSAADEIAAGNTDHAIPYDDRKDDFGRLAKALHSLRDFAHKAKISDSAHDGEQDKDALRKKNMSDEIAQFKALSDRSYGLVVGAAGELDATFSDMNKIVMEAEQKSDSAAQLSEKTANNVNQVAVSAEELTASSEEISQRINKSAQNAKDALDKILVGERSAEELSKAAEKIGNVIRVISGIAEQTNLLALNATIEAARAGDAGKGFAVVASEVKNLSQDTAKATDTVIEQVQGIQEIAKQMVEIISLLKQTIVSSTEYAASISASIVEQHAVTGEIARNMQVASTSVTEISNNIMQVKAITKKAGAASQDVRQASEMLTRQAESLNAGLQSFISKIQN